MKEIDMTLEAREAIESATLLLKRGETLIYHKGASVGVENRGLAHAMAQLAQSGKTRLHQRRVGRSDRFDFLACYPR